MGIADLKGVSFWVTIAVEMKFFIPFAQDDSVAEHTYAAIREFVGKQVPYEMTDRRIFSVQYRHSGKTFKATVGETLERVNEPIIAILETSGVYCACTPNRGVVRGDPYLIGTQEIVSIQDFETAQQGAGSQG